MGVLELVVVQQFGDIAGRNRLRAGIFKFDFEFVAGCDLFSGL